MVEVYVSSSMSMCKGIITSDVKASNKNIGSKKCKDNNLNKKKK